MAKLYKYKKNGKIEGDFEWSQLQNLNLPEDTEIWTEQFCPKHLTAQNCSDHWMTLKAYKSKLATRRLWAYLFLVVVVIFFGYPYIGTSNGQYKKREKISQELKVGIDKLTFELRSTKETEYYKVKKVPTQELVEDIKGDYFIVDLNLAHSKEKVLFNAGEYVIDDLNDEFLNALGKFMDEVYYMLDQGFECQLFVKGSADILGQMTFKGNLDKRYGAKEGFTKIEYLKMLDSSHFANDVKVQAIKEGFSNTELPNLRGKFIQYKIKQNFKGVNPIILEGEVTGKNPNKNLRNAYLFLFVNWNKKKYLG